MRISEAFEIRNTHRVFEKQTAFNYHELTEKVNIDTLFSNTYDEWETTISLHVRFKLPQHCSFNESNPAVINSKKQIMSAIYGEIIELNQKAITLLYNFDNESAIDLLHQANKLMRSIE